jgi:hypothetical protein
MVNKPLNKLLLILLAVFLLPLCIFTVYQVSTLNENEKVITEIYDQQLEAILLSVNQYSQDLVDAWASELSDAQLDSAHLPERVKEFLLQNETVQYILWSDTTLEKTYLWSIMKKIPPEVNTELMDTIQERTKEIDKLKE